MKTTQFLLFVAITASCMGCATHVTINHYTPGSVAVMLNGIPVRGGLDTATTVTVRNGDQIDILEGQ